MKISVITAVYNRGDTIAAALDSIAEQDHADIEHVVIDGGSTDGTLAVLEAHRQRIAVLVTEPDTGIYDALNKGLARCSGDVIGFLHADDLLGDRQVLSTIAVAFLDPAVDAIYGDLVYVRKDDTDAIVRYWRPGEFRSSRLQRGWMPPHPTLFVRRKVYEDIGGFDTRYHIAADYDSILRMFSSHCIKPVYIPRILVRMRVGGASNKSLRNLWLKSSEDYRILRRNGVGGLGALILKNVSKLPQFIGTAAGRTVPSAGPPGRTPSQR